MRYRAFFTILPLLLLTGCGLIFKRGIDSAVTTFVQGVIPDTCDLHLFIDIVNYREDSLRFPAYPWTMERIQSQSKACQESYDSINILPYGLDSADVFMIKNFTYGENQSSSFHRYYRFRFENDLLLNMTPYLITSKIRN